MWAVVMDQTGDPEVLRYEEVERPEPAEGEVLIRGRAAAMPSSPRFMRLRSPGSRSA